jgi:hypothetical protein
MSSFAIDDTLVWHLRKILLGIPIDRDAIPMMQVKVGRSLVMNLYSFVYT